MKLEKGWLAIGAIVAASGLIAPLLVRADENAGDKVKDAAGDASTGAKKTARHAKQKARKAAGTDNKAKDAKDKINDTTDDMDNSADKLKRKAAD